MASSEGSSVPARLRDLKDTVKERFLALGSLFGRGTSKAQLLEDEDEVYLQVGRTVWHAPRQLRIELWLSSLARRHSLVAEYQNYLGMDIGKEAATDIDKDVQRTFPNTRRFHEQEGQVALRNVLRAYAAYDPEVAYCQGMNFLTGLLLMYMPTEGHAFAALVVLMEDRKLRSLYHRSMALLQVQLWQLSRLVSPALNQHLEGLGVVPMLYGASWLMTAFSADFPIPFSARIMDVLLAEQCECALLKVSVAIMKACESKLLAMNDLEEVLGHLKLDVPAWEEPELNALLTAAFTKPWTARQLSILRSTEGAETVAQAMDRVMAMNEQLAPCVQAVEDEEGGEDGEAADGRVAVTIPRLQPPPQPPNSFAASPACTTPVGPGPMGTGSMGGSAAVPMSAGGASTGGSPPAAAGAPKCGASAAGAGSAGGSGTASPAVWSIPSIHPNITASPAIQAFRRAHLPCLQNAVIVGPARSARSILSNVSAASDARGGACDASGDDGSYAASGAGSGAGGVQDPRAIGGLLGAMAEEWGDFNAAAAAAARQQWRSLSKSTPGSMRQHDAGSSRDESASGEQGQGQAREITAWRGSSVAGLDAAGGPASSAPPAGGLAPSPSLESQPNSVGGASSGGSGGGAPSQPIPVPGAGSNRNVGSAFAVAAVSAAAAAGMAPSASGAGRPPLPPRCPSFDRASAMGAAFSRLSVVAEDPPAVVMGPVAPAPSPRGSMDLHVLGQASSQQYEYGDQYGLLLGHGSVGGAGNAFPAGAGSASCNGDCATGTASATTPGALMSPSGISGAMSPHAASPRHMYGWSGGGGSGAAGGGSDTPTNGYLPVGVPPASLERGASGFLGDNAVAPASLTSPVGSATASAHQLHLSSGEHRGLLPPPPPPAPTGPPANPPAAKLPADMATDIAGDILRMLSAVDAGNAHAAYDTRAVLGESMYADSPSGIPKEKRSLVHSQSEALRHVPSSSALAEIAAQDLARAQEQAERMRQELSAQLQATRASERGGQAGAGACGLPITPMPTGASAASVEHPDHEDPAAPQSSASFGSTFPPVVSGAASGGSFSAGRGEGGQGGLQSAGQTADPASASAAGEGPLSGAAGSDAAAVPGASAGSMSNGGMAASGSSGSGPDVLVLKRPPLYVDGIPMWDPKSLMGGHEEAKAMFTPAVSPGASSYADPLPSAVSAATTTGGAPPDLDILEVSDDDEEAEAAAAAAATRAATRAAAVLAGAGASAGGTLAAAAATLALEAAAGQRAREPGAAGPAGAAQPGTAPGDRHGAEWVDWSQAPPLRAAPAVTVPHCGEDADDEAEEDEEEGEAAMPLLSPGGVSLAAEGAGPTAAQPTPKLRPRSRACGGAASPVGGLRHAGSSSDLTSPTRRSRLATSSSGPKANATSSATTSPSKPDLTIATTDPDPTASACLDDDGLSGSSAAVAAAKRYGLLPAASQLTIIAPLAPSHASACNSTAPTPAGPCPGPSIGSGQSTEPGCTTPGGGASFTLSAGTRGPGLGWSQLRCDSLAPSDPSCSRVGSHRWGLGGLSCSDQEDHEESDGTPRADGLRGYGHPMLPTGALNPPLLATSTGSFGSANGSGLSCTAIAAATFGLGSMARSSFTSRPGQIDEGDEAEAGDGDGDGRGAAADGEGRAEGAEGEASFSGPDPPSMELPASFDASALAGARASADAEYEASDAAAELELSATEAVARGEGLGTEGSDQEGSEREGEEPTASAADASASEAEGMAAQGSAELGEEGGEGSPFRAALSPSLAHHIMSAYLRCEAHQQQQEQREAEEHQQRLQQEQDRHQHQHSGSEQESHDSGVAGVPMPSDLGSGSTGGDGSTTAPSFAAGTAAGSGSAVLSSEVPMLAVADLTGVHTVNGTLLEEYGLSNSSLGPMAPLTSPSLGSPVGIAWSNGGGAGVGGSTAAAAAAAAAAAGVTSTTGGGARPLTPFAMSLADPATSRLQAELLQSMPLQLQQPDTPTPPPAPMPGAGSSCNAGAGLHGAGRAPRYTGSGDVGADLSLANTGVGRLSGLSGAGSSGGVQYCGNGLSSGGVGGAGGVLRAYGSHDSSSAAPSCGGGGVSAAAAALHQLGPHASTSARGSGGGAMPPLLPPPPPPSLPLCATMAKLEASAAAAAAVSAVNAAAPSASHSHGHLPLQGSTSVCVAAVSLHSNGPAAGSFGGACSHASASASGAAAPLQAAPSWTATFDEVGMSLPQTRTGHAAAAAAAAATAAADDHSHQLPAHTQSHTPLTCNPEPHSVFAGAAEQAHTAHARHSMCGFTTTSTGVRTPDAYPRTPDMARGMSGEAPLPPLPPPPALRQPLQHRPVAGVPPDDYSLGY